MQKTLLLIAFLIPIFAGATNYYVSTSGNDANDGLTTATAVLTINQAVSLSINGDVVNIAAGNYVEQVSINAKSVELKGAGVGSTIIQSPASLPLSFLRNGIEQHAIVMANNASNVKVDNLTVDGQLLGATIAGAAPSYDFVGIAYNNTSGTIDNVEVKNMSDNPANTAQRGTGIVVYANGGVALPISITNGNVHDVQRNGLVLDGANSVVTVTNNTVTGYGSSNAVMQNGIVVSGAAFASIRTNIISGFDYLPGNLDAGISLSGAANGTVVNANNISNCNAAVLVDAATTISQNTITNPVNGYGIYVFATSLRTIGISNNFVSGGHFAVYFDTLTAPINAGVHNNSLTNADSFIIANKSNFAAVDASCNWYGTSNRGIVPTKIYGNVNFVPFLSLGTDIDPTTPGFQPNISSCSTPVPLALLSFTAIKNNNLVSLKWSTANELNVNHFEVERSFNNTIGFQQIGAIKAIGNTTAQIDYAFTDVDAPNIGTYYYRLKITDNDGAFTFGPVKTILNNAEATINYTLFPNPVSRNSPFTITGPSTTDYTVYQLLDASGRLLKTGNFMQHQTITIPFPGIYFIEMITEGMKEVKKIMVK